MENNRPGGPMIVRWTTGAEHSTAGFRLLRSASGARAAAVIVTERLILARGGPAAGASYAWVDLGARPGDWSAYWLQEIERGGEVHEYGPAERGPGSTPAGKWTLWLPAL